MTMHLLGPQFTSLSTRKHKNKAVILNAKFAEEFRLYNKQMKRLGLSCKTLQEYIDYKQGKTVYKPKIMKDSMISKTYQRPSPEVHSTNGVGNGFAKPAMSYSGERKLIGIGTMHKSNLVPIFEQSDAEDIARMRR